MTLPHLRVVFEYLEKSILQFFKRLFVSITLIMSQIYLLRLSVEIVVSTKIINFSIAERITAHETPLNMHYWRGFLFLVEILYLFIIKARIMI